ncbi:MAG: hypothetical protein ACO1OK_03360, partial [Devosia sp.]
MSIPAPPSAPAIEAEDARPLSLAPNAMRLALGLALALALFHLYSALAGTQVLPGVPLVSSEVLRRIHAGGALALLFILYPGARGRMGPVLSLGLAALALLLIAYTLATGDALARRSTRPEVADVLVAGLFILVLLEATRR